jgi:hypothetical protein
MSEGSEEFALFERVFAQVLGIDENEEFARELTLYAAELIHTLPPGWELIIGEGDLAGIPMYVYADTQETEWSHPYESEYRRRIQTRRNELIYQAEQNAIAQEEENERGNLLGSSSFNADTIETDYYENSEQYLDDEDAGGIDVTRNVAEQRIDTGSNEIEDYEGVFAEVLGVKAGEKYYLQLATLARDLMRILPDGWELLINEADNGVKVPYYFETARALSHWTHPFEEQYKEVIANKREEFANASTSPRSPLHTARSRRSEISVGTSGSMDESERQALIEAMFAGSLGINPLEEFAEELGDYAKELLQTLPGGWEVVVADNGSSADIFPLFVNATGESQLDHPMLAEHTESIIEMRNALTYGVLPGVYGDSAPQEGASAEPSAEFLAQQRAEEQAQQQAIAAAEAEEEARQAQEQQAVREEAERRAAEQAAATAAAAAEEEENRQREEAARAAAAEEEEEEEEVNRQREAAARVAAKELQLAEERGRAAALAAEEEARVAVAASAADDVSVTAVEAEASPSQAGEQQVTHSTAEVEVVAVAAKEASPRPHPADLEKAAEDADNDSVAAGSLGPAMEGTTPAAERAISAAQSVDGDDLAERSVLSEGTALTLGHASVDGHHIQSALEEFEELRPHPETPSMKVIGSVPDLPTEHRATPVQDVPEPALDSVPAEEVAAGDTDAALAETAAAVETAPAAALPEEVPTDSAAQGEQDAAQVACADSIVGEVTDGVAAETATELVAEREAEIESAIACAGDVIMTEIVTQFAKVAAKEALAQAAAEKEAEDRLEEERAAAARVERRAAEKKAAELAAEEARVKAEAEQAALDASATNLFQQELERARQTANQKAADAVEASAASDVVPLQRMPSEAAFSSEPDALSQTLGGAEIAQGMEEEKLDSASVPAPQLGNLAAPAVPPPVTGGFDLASIGNNAVRMNTQYLDALGSGKTKDDKRRTSKRVTTPDAPELAALKLRESSKDAAAGESSGAEGSGKESGNEAGKSGKAKLRPLSKVSPKKAAQKRKQDGVSVQHPPQSPNGTLRGLHKERLWEVKATKDSAELAVASIKWFTLGCYEKFDDAVSSRKTIAKLVISDSQGTILIDPRVDISDFDLVSARHAEERAAAGGDAAGDLPAADDTRELILGRVKRTMEKSCMIRVRKDLSRMQWVVETDELEISKITDRHRKKKGVDIEGKSEDAVKIKAKNALKAMQKAKETEGDFAFQTMRDLPPMDELIEADLLQVLSTAKSFGGFTLTSKLIEHEKKVKEELANKLGNKKKVVEAPQPVKAAKKEVAPLQRAASVSSKNRLILPDIASSKAK